MRARDLVFIGAALLAGAVSTELADGWSERGWVAQVWFLGLAPAVLDVVHPSIAWCAATIVYALQCVTLYVLVESAFAALMPVRTTAAPEGDARGEGF